MAYGRLEVTIDVIGLNGRNNEPMPKKVVVGLLRDVEDDTAQEVVDKHGSSVSYTNGPKYEYMFTPHPTKLEPRPYSVGVKVAR